MKKTHRKKFCALVLAAALVMGGAAGLTHRRVDCPAWVPVRLAEHQIILDAGHGGEDGGAVSVTGISESVINLAVTQKLDQLLGFCGLAPVLVRDSDISVYDPGCSTLHEKKVSDIRNRVALIDGTEHALVISIHQNTFEKSSYHGAQVFFRAGEESQALAELVQNTLREALDPENNRVPTKIPDSVYLMAHIHCPAVLVECGFLSNAAEEEKLRRGGYQIQLALCIASALMKMGGSETGKPVL